ncbi:5-formyltetrahydrofolate cyclo-ligase [Azospirillaceae bacterium]
MPQSSDAGLHDAKTGLRARARMIRNRIAPALPNAGEQIRDRILHDIALPETAVISGYWPIGTELDIRPFLFAWHNAGRTSTLPVVIARQHPLTFRHWTPETQLSPGPFKILQPTDANPLIVPDVLIVPLLAFDRTGHRLGYGGAYYDLTIAERRASNAILAIGVGFSGQEIDAIPFTAQDQRLDWIVTEQFSLKIS